MTNINTIRTNVHKGDVSRTSFINCKLNSVDGKYCLVTIKAHAVQTQHFCNGILHDNMQEPAMQNHINGYLIELNRYKFGRLHDMDEFNPAVVVYFDNTKNVMKISRYKNGLANNSKNGLPARQEFYPKGGIKSCSYYENNKLNNYGDIPAYRYWNPQGYVVTSENYCDGVKL